VSLATGVDPTTADIGFAPFESYTYWHTVDGKFRTYNGSSWVDTATVTGGITMDSAYNGGSAVTVDTAAVSFTNAHATIDTLTVANSHATGAGDGIQITMSGATSTGHGLNIDITGATSASNAADLNISQAGATGHCLNLANSGTGNLINGANFSLTPAGAVVCVGLNAGNAAIVTTGTLGAAATTLTGLLTVSAGGAAITGNSTVTGDLAVTGALSFGGTLTIGDTLTVDELILDTDGIAPAATNSYLVRVTDDNILNCITGGFTYLDINNTHEYKFGASSVDLNSNHLDNAGYLILNAVTLPAATEVYVGHDNTGDCTINALTGKDVNFAINGTDEARIKANEVELVSGTNLQFLGDDDIVDSGGNELITFSATGSALNGLQVKNAATGARPAIGSNGAGAEADIGLNLLDSNGNELVELVAVATATNGLLITNAATGDPVQIGANGTGATANRGIRLNDSNGNEELVLVSTASAVNEIGIVNTATGNKPIIRVQGEGDLGLILANFDGTNTEEILILVSPASAVNEVTITSAATAGNPTIAATGGDADIHLVLNGKGTGGVNLTGNTLFGATASGGDLTLSSTSHATKGDIRIANGEVDQRWINSLGNETESVFIDADYIVGIARSGEISLTGGHSNDVTKIVKDSFGAMPDFESATSKFKTEPADGEKPRGR